ncbi:class I SAM-dependent methyltransferase [Paraburkholderia sartisoli]|uniref:Methyltransferase domain-containing protein n=1 Tax=Paraburkholderia sartisoli TaxID=83784 RepID=A0A1H4FZZ3_9BURK|nr:class I SAM-dependent methyltransferase [Paraburkholderia sartisoli]SEB02854.1 Methyltransferase domain-containing protein [Paraburkholderia sartisoli]
MNCRHCGHPLTLSFLDLGFAPPSNAYLNPADLTQPERYYPLKLFVCDECWLVQTEDYASREALFDADYAYFSSVSESWLEHARRYASSITDTLSLDNRSFVIEVASNDGYLLRNFVAADIPCLGIEPTASTAARAEAQGIPVIREFFGEQLARTLAAEGKQADLVIGNNVFAHVPDVTDFTLGLKTVLKPGGTVTLEFPHLVCLIDEGQFDTVYHEHFSYFSLHAVEHIFAAAGLRAYRVEQLKTHGGSLRVYGCHAEDTRTDDASVERIRMLERERGIAQRETYEGFQSRVNTTKNGLLRFLIESQEAGLVVAAYGAAAKGNTLLNYAGVKPDLLPFVCDFAPSKQGKFMPGSHIPIVSPTELARVKPDIVLILPWNISDEIIAQQSAALGPDVRFAVAMPEIRYL